MSLLSAVLLTTKVAALTAPMMDAQKNAVSTPAHRQLAAGRSHREGSAGPRLKICWWSIMFFPDVKKVAYITILPFYILCKNILRSLNLLMGM
ncbi:MAG: hypothetical protein H7203_02180 [Rhizobacter sp.]|nr:hypothetical protein [Burkholderiales bacterium]